jgi:hypothetical protein
MLTEVHERILEMPADHVFRVITLLNEGESFTPFVEIKVWEIEPDVYHIKGGIHYNTTVVDELLDYNVHDLDLTGNRPPVNTMLLVQKHLFYGIKEMERHGYKTYEHIKKIVERMCEMKGFK